MSDEGALAEHLIRRLRALSSPVRLQILRALVTPTRAADVRVRAAGERAGLGADRFVARTTVIEHLQVLEEAGLVRRVGDAFAVDQQAMVATLQELGMLANLRALVEVDVETTLAAPQPPKEPLPPMPRLLFGNGPQSGRGVALHGAGPWRVGRTPDCDVPLTHDPHVSRHQMTLERVEGGFRCHVAASVRNPVLVDFERVPPGGSCGLRAGSVLLVGATLLVLQA